MNPFTMLFFGASGAGKSYLATRMQDILRQRQQECVHFDGDLWWQTMMDGAEHNVRTRSRNVELLGKAASLLNQQGMCVVISTCAPLASLRNLMGRPIKNFFTIEVQASRGTRMLRKPKLYGRPRCEASDDADTIPGHDIAIEQSISDGMVIANDTDEDRDILVHCALDAVQHLQEDGNGI